MVETIYVAVYIDDVLVFSLSPVEKNYSITDLETLAVVWAIQHFRAYLYGHKVTVVTDHLAVKSILGAPGNNGKHARWWLKVFQSGVKDVQIVYIDRGERRYKPMHFLETQHPLFKF